MRNYEIINIYVYILIYIYTYTYVYRQYIYIYRKRKKEVERKERERSKESKSEAGAVTIKEVFRRAYSGAFNGRSSYAPRRRRALSQLVLTTGGLGPQLRPRERAGSTREDDHNSLFDRHVGLHESEGIFGRATHAFRCSQERRGDFREGTLVKQLSRPGNSIVVTS